VTDLPAPVASRAVLVGVSEYSSQSQLPAVANNLRELRRLFTNTDFWGLPEEHCTTLLNPESTEQVLDAVHTAAAAASEALVFYFAGHGLLDDRGDLHFAMPTADQDRLYRAVRYDDVRREIFGATYVLAKVVILDCCFSGSAMLGGMGGSDDLADQTQIDGTYLMTASAETKPALATPGQEFTAFTGALLDHMKRGVPDGPSVLDMETLFHHVRTDLQARQQPVPQQRIRNDGRSIALVRNRHGASGEPAAVPPARRPPRPRPPTEFDDMQRWPPNKLVAHTVDLRSAGSGAAADQVLAASAAWRADQEVAAIIDVLSHQERIDDLRTVRAAVLTRTAVQVLRIVDALHDTGQDHQACELLRAAAATEAADVAMLARLLRNKRRNDDLVVLLDNALATAQQQSLARLVNELWGAGLQREVDQLVIRAARTLPGSAVTELADELRAVGREETAFGLYLLAPDAVVTTRPAVAVAQVFKAMVKTGDKRNVHSIATALIETVGGADRAVEVAQAFWKVNCPDHAMRALERATATMTDTEVLTFAADLRALHRDQAAYKLCLHHAIGRPDSVIKIVTALREAGRPVDANKLLNEAAYQIPIPADRVAMVAAADLESMLTLVAELRTLHRNDPAYDLCARTAVERPEWTIRIVTVLREENRSVEAENLLKEVTLRATVPAVAGLVRDCAPREQKNVLADAVRRTPSDVSALLDALQLTAPALATQLTALAVESMTTHPALVPILLQRCDPPLRAEIMSWATETTDGRTAMATLGESGLRAYQDVLLSEAAGDHVIATHVASLHDLGRKTVIAALLTRTLENRDRRQAMRFVEAIRTLRHQGALDAMADWVQVRASSEANARYTLLRLGLREYVTPH
jgi:hypothetical protein